MPCVSLSIHIQIVFQVFLDHPLTCPSIHPVDGSIILRNICREPKRFPLPYPKQSTGSKQSIGKHLVIRSPAAECPLGACWSADSWPHPSPAESETLRVGLEIFIFNRYPKRFSYTKSWELHISLPNNAKFKTSNSQYVLLSVSQHPGSPGLHQTHCWCGIRWAEQWSELGNLVGFCFIPNQEFVEYRHDFLDHQGCL